LICKLTCKGEQTSWSESENSDGDHADIRGSAKPLPHDSEPSPSCPRTKRVGRDHIAGGRGFVGNSASPDHDVCHHPTRLRRHGDRYLLEHVTKCPDEAG